MRGLLIGIFLLSAFALPAQDLSLTCKSISTFNEPVLLDSLSALQSSIQVTDEEGNSYSHQYNPTTGELTIYGTSISSVKVCYKTIPFSFHETYQFRDMNSYDSMAYFEEPALPTASFTREELFPTQNIEKTGSISRGVSFGSNQDVFVNSTLNLNLNGKLADDLYLQAAITDQNVPFQPEGNTQQLQDFDNVFIRIYNERFSLRGGDVVLRNRDDSYFLRYLKNVQGGLASYSYSMTNNDSATTQLGLSVARGRFASVQIEAQEGILGPYRIPGPENQPFVLILANSEKVFLDGKRLKRGFNHDYIIDYNSGELTFMNTVLITQFSRIRVDYELSDQDFSRAIQTVAHQQQIGKVKVNVDYYKEKDNPRQPLASGLSNDEKLFLSDIGDQLDNVLQNSADSVGFEENTIRYQRKDTLVNGSVISIFEYSTDPENAVYRVTFAEVGEGNGNYVSTIATANGRVYEWVAPLNGVAQGSFEPLTTIAVPDQRELYAARVGYQINEHEQVEVDMALSNRDLNLYSDLDDEDNVGKAIKFQFHSKDRAISDDIRFHSSIGYEYNDRFFTPVDRFRYIEFDRNWNYDPTDYDRQGDEHILSAKVGIEQDDNNKVSYGLTHRKRTNQMEGIQHEFDAQWMLSKIKLATQGFFMNNDLRNATASWNQFSTDLSYQGKFLIPGIRYTLDQNRIQKGDSIIGSAMFFEEQMVYIKNPSDSEWNVQLQHASRTDSRPINGQIQEFMNSETSQMSLGRNWKNHQFKANLIYRTIAFTDDAQPDDEIVSGRLNWSGRFWKNSLRANVTYAVANSQELRREFIFIPVPIGQGTHAWRDLNDNGVQELNEFFIAINPDEMNFAKILIPTRERITAYQNQLVAQVHYKAPAKWRQLGGIAGILGKLSGNTALTSDIKTTDEALKSRLLAFATSIPSEMVLADRYNLRSTLFFNRQHAVYGMELNYLQSGRKQLLTDGFDQMNREEWTTNFRYNLSPSWTLQLRSGKGERESLSDFLDGRNYRIEMENVRPELRWQPNQNVRLSAFYRYEEKRNEFDAESDERAYLQGWGGELRMSKNVTNMIQADFRYTTISYNGELNTPVAYDMLNALQPGRNLNWSVNWQQKLINGLQLQLSYNGRKSEDADVVHIGRVQLSALF